MMTCEFCFVFVCFVNHACVNVVFSASSVFSFCEVIVSTRHETCHDSMPYGIRVKAGVGRAGVEWTAIALSVGLSWTLDDVTLPEVDCGVG